MCVSDVSWCSSPARNNIFLTFPHWNNRRISSTPLRAAALQSGQWDKSPVEAFIHILFYLLSLCYIIIPKIQSPCLPLVACVQQGVSTSSIFVCQRSSSVHTNLWHIWSAGSRMGCTLWETNLDLLILISCQTLLYFLTSRPDSIKILDTEELFPQLGLENMKN